MNIILGRREWPWGIDFLQEHSHRSWNLIGAMQNTERLDHFVYMRSMVVLQDFSVFASHNHHLILIFLNRL